MAQPAAVDGAGTLRSVRDADVAGRRVLVRADLDVPLAGGRVADDAPIRAVLPTLELLRDRGAAAVTVCSHLGRATARDPAFAVAPVAARLHELFAGPPTVVENTRFDPGEAANDSAAARRLAQGHDLFVEDAFGSVQHAHASTVGVADLLPAYAGLLVEAELEHLGRLAGDVRRPFVLVLGGAKAEEKSGVLERLGPLADWILVGGRLAEQVRVSRPDLDVELPVDAVAAPRFAPSAPRQVLAPPDVPYGWTVLDVGPRTRRRYASLLARARTTFWSGPMGVFEWDGCREGTATVATAIAWSGAYSVVAGTDTARALRLFGVADRISWTSTGGRAALALLAGRELPGLAVIPSR